MSGRTRVTAEWAVWGKRSGTRDDYGILDCSKGPLSRDDFAEIMTRYAPGTLEHLPQVTLSWVGGGDTAYIGMAIQDWSGRQDGLSRDIAETRYFGVPYAQAAASPVSYTALHHAFDVCALPVAGPLSVEVDVLDPHAIAETVDKTVMGAASLLLTGKEVCVVRGESVPMPDRLRFLDAVAALLPYGLRTRLTASTWTDSSAKHRIMLSFAKHAREGAHSVVWGAYENEHPLRHDVATRYFETLLAGSPEDLVGRLAMMTEPMSFRTAGHQTLALLDDSRQTLVHAGWPGPPGRTAGEDLNLCADFIGHKRHQELKDPLERLYHLLVAARLTDDEVRGNREIIEGRSLLRAGPRSLGGLRDRFYDVVLAAGYGPELTLEGLGDVRRSAPDLPRPLVLAMARMPPAEPAVSLRLVSCLDGEEQARALAALQTADLVRAAAREPFDEDILWMAYTELVARGADGGTEDTGIAAALYEHGYLADAVEACHPQDGDMRFTMFRHLLTAAYGTALDRQAYEEIVGCPAVPRSVSLTVAASSLYGWESERVLMEAFVRHAQLDPATRNQVRECLAAPASRERAPALHEHPPASRERAPATREVVKESLGPGPSFAEGSLQQRDGNEFVAMLRQEPRSGGHGWPEPWRITLIVVLGVGFVCGLIYLVIILVLQS
ncbi:hypothetical protein [Sphaerisporangium corydalis]|uniref:Uncharacterized protein n=1 Tax=Sphaerisporangium corydalis TaxID=1441875 RepID=A0ABV9EAX6_9ACTN|nr:hypothetical protein [Sphaerisporangium corydalis]